ncbi:MAG: 2-keto-4-pentenoate hydratase [Candidatus Rokuibacteriota bacterium]
MTALEPFLDARADHRPIAPPSEQRRLDAAEAYAVQDRLRAALIARGERVIGWKTGFTSRATQKMFDTDEPVCAFLLASGVFASGAEVPCSRFAAVVVEAEIAFVMRHDLAGPGVTPPRALQAVEGALPALELVDFRYTGKPVASDLIADGVYANAIVLGTALTPVAHLDLALEGLVYEMNGAIAATNTAAEVLGSPANSLAWIANQLGGRGLGLRAGDVVMSGSVSALLRPKPGDAIRATYTRLGSVSARFV